MSSPRRRAAAVSAAVAGVAVVATVTSAPASSADVAAPSIVSVTSSPSGGVVLATVASPSAVLTLRARVTDASGVDRVVLGLYDPAGQKPDGRTLTATRTAGTWTDGTWVATLSLPRESPAGKWTVRAFATDVAGNISEPDTTYGTVLVRRATRFADYNAGPEPAPAGTPLAFSGTLQRYVPGTGWAAYGGVKVQLQFRAPGTTAWVPSGAVRTTDATGAYATPAPAATATGAWRVTFAGTGTRAPASSHSDNVEVTPAP